MPFGLTNAPAAFQCFVNTIFADMLDVCIVVYLDDILIYSKDMESHQQHVWEVLHHPQLHGLFAKPEKCEFHLDSVEYLGYHLSPDGLTMFPDKIQTISNWPEPRKVKDIQSFLGFANFYRQFIFNYLDIVVPLTQCHAPNRFGTVNMEDNVNIKRSWCEGWAQWSLIVAIYRTRRLSWCKRWLLTLTVITRTRTAKKQKKLKE